MSLIYVKVLISDKVHLASLCRFLTSLWTFSVCWRVVLGHVPQIRAIQWPKIDSEAQATLTVNLPKNLTQIMFWDNLRCQIRNQHQISFEFQGIENSIFVEYEHETSNIQNFDSLQLIATRRWFCTRMANLLLELVDPRPSMLLCRQRFLCLRHASVTPINDLMPSRRVKLSRKWSLVFSLNSNKAWSILRDYTKVHHIRLCGAVVRVRNHGRRNRPKI